MSLYYVTYLGSSAFESPTFAVHAPLSKTNTSFVTAILHCYFIDWNTTKNSQRYLTSLHISQHTHATGRGTLTVNEKIKHKKVVIKMLPCISQITTCRPILRITHIMAVAGHLRRDWFIELPLAKERCAYHFVGSQILSYNSRTWNLWLLLLHSVRPVKFKCYYIKWCVFLYPEIQNWTKWGALSTRYVAWKLKRATFQFFFLITFCGPFIVIYLRNKDQQDNLLSFVD